MYREQSFGNEPDPEQKELPREIEVKIINLGDPEKFFSRLEQEGAVLLNDRRLLSDTSFRRPYMLDTLGDFDFNFSEIEDVKQFNQLLDFLGIDVLEQNDDTQKMAMREGEPVRSVRLRHDGDKFLFTVKEKRAGMAQVDNRVEVEVEIPDDGSIEELLNSIGYISKTRKEKYRKTYEIDGCKVEYNEGPVGEPWGEIEGKSEEAVLALAEKLGYKPEDVQGMSDADYYEKYCPGWLSEDDINNMTFERMQGKNK